MPPLLVPSPDQSSAQQLNAIPPVPPTTSTHHQGGLASALGGGGGLLASPIAMAGSDRLVGPIAPIAPIAQGVVSGLVQNFSRNGGAQQHNQFMGIASPGVANGGMGAGAVVPPPAPGGVRGSGGSGSSPANRVLSGGQLAPPGTGAGAARAAPAPTSTISTSVRADHHDPPTTMLMNPDLVLAAQQQTRPREGALQYTGTPSPVFGEREEAEHPPPLSIGQLDGSPLQDTTNLSSAFPPRSGTRFGGAYSPPLPATVRRSAGAAARIHSAKSARI